MRQLEAPPWRGLCALQVVLLQLLLLVATRCSAQSWQRVDGEQLVRAVEEFGRSNRDLTVQLSASYIDLRNATFRRPTTSATGARPFSNGTLTLLGERIDTSNATTAVAHTVIDAAQRQGLTPTLITAGMEARDLALVNLCYWDIPLGGGRLVTPILLGIFSLSPVAKSLHVDRVIMYIPQASLAWTNYIGFLSAVPWKALTDAYAQQLGGFASLSNGDSGLGFGAYDLAVSLPSAAPMFDGNCIWRSQDKPNDPLLEFMRQEGLLMAPRWCGNGTLVQESITRARMDMFWGPTWMAEQQDDIVAGLFNFTAVAPIQQAAKRPVPLIMIFKETVPLPDGALPDGSLQLTAPLALSGLLDGAAPVQSALDLTGRATPLFSLSGTAVLYVRTLGIRAPAILVAGLPGRDSLVTALPLTSLAVAANGSVAGSPLVQLYLLTLNVPTLDFLALLTLATDRLNGTSNSSSGVRRCMEMDVLVHAARLQPFIQALEWQDSSWEALRLHQFAAWRVNGSQLTVRPQTPVPESVVRQCAGAVSPSLAPAPSAASGDGGGGSSSAPVGAIVGGVVGGVALLALAAAALVLHRRRRAQREGQALLDPGPSAAGSVPKQAASSSTADVLLSLAGSEGRRAKTGSSSGSGTLPVVGGSGPRRRPSMEHVLAANQSKLVALLDQQEQQLLLMGSRATGIGAGLEAASTAAGGTGAGRLNDAHEQLMSMVVAQQQQGRGGGPEQQEDRGSGGGRAGGSGRQSGAGEGSRASGASAGTATSDPRRNVMEVAARLQGEPGGADKVTLQHVLGRGGSGIVYLGTWRGLPVAVKTMVFEAWEGDVVGAGGGAAAGSKPFVRAIMETAISASIGHRHVVATYHYDIKRVDDKRAGDAEGLQISVGSGATGSTSGSAGVQTYKIFLVQELCTCSLRMVLEHDVLNCDPGQDRLCTVMAVLHQVALGLEYLHGMGIIHGDLTPPNILMKMDPSAPDGVVVKLADFGLSQRLDAQATHVSNFGAGTPFYVAPEVATMKRTSLAADVFSFGVIAWEVYTGHSPFATESNGAVQRNPLFPTFTQLEPAFERCADLERLIHRCLAADPRLRPAASQLAAALAGLVGRSAATRAPPSGVGSTSS